MVYALGARARLFESRYTVHADFTEVGGLNEGATVRLAGVQIGRVKRVNLPAEPGGKVRVDLTIAKRFGNRVRKNSVARIETQGLLGDRIVELTVGTAEAPPTKDGDVVLARDPTDFSKIVSEGAQTVKNVAALAESLKGTADGLRQSRLVEDASATLASARKVTDQVSRIVGEVEQGRGWAHALIYEEPVALRKINDVIASTQRLLDRVERGEGAAGVLTSETSTAAARSGASCSAACSRALAAAASQKRASELARDLRLPLPGVRLRQPQTRHVPGLSARGRRVRAAGGGAGPGPGARASPRRALVEPPTAAQGRRARGRRPAAHGHR